MAIKIRINRKSVESMTKQITDQLGDLIKGGTLAVGSLLPSERTLWQPATERTNISRLARSCQKCCAGKL